jgi:hypothetical protein
LPKDLVQLPVMQALMTGKPAAVSAHLKGFENREEADLFREHKKKLEQAGFGFYKSMSGHLGVLFNYFHVHPADLQAADKAGKLEQIAPPYDVVHKAVANSGHTNPVLSVNSLPQGMAQAMQQPPPQASAGIAPGQQPTPMAGPVKQASGGVQRRLMNARVAAAQPGAPTSGPVPGQGRLMNTILKGIV